jgi:hypothetical protein
MTEGDFIAVTAEPAPVALHSAPRIRRRVTPPPGVHGLIRKVDLQVIVDPTDFEAAVSALHKGLIDWAPAATPRLQAVA